MDRWDERITKRELLRALAVLMKKFPADYSGFRLRRAANFDGYEGHYATDDRDARRLRVRGIRETGAVMRHDLRHCDKGGCCVGVLIGICRRCGFRVACDGECPATEDLPESPGGFWILSATHVRTSSKPHRYPQEE